MKEHFPGVPLSEDELRTVIVMTGVLVIAFLSEGPKAPKWAKDLPPSFERHAGPWRGKGSLGRGFGPQARHR